MSEKSATSSSPDMPPAPAPEEDPSHGLSPAVHKFARYLGLIPGLFLLYLAYFSNEVRPTPHSQEIATRFAVPVPTSVPSLFASRSTPMREISGYLLTERACKSNNVPSFVAQCDWWAVLSFSSLVYESTIPVPAGFPEEARALFARYLELSAARDKAKTPAQRPTEEQWAALEAERNEMLLQIRERVDNAPRYLLKKLAIAHGATLLVIVLLLWGRHLVGLAFILPAVGAGRFMARALKAVHKSV